MTVTARAAAVAWLSAGAALWGGCAPSKPRGPSSVAASVIRAGAQCGGEATGPWARWIATEGGFRAAMGAGGAFGAEPGAPVDFKREGVLAVYAGQRPTGGYGLALEDATVHVKDGVGTVVVRFEEPPPGALVAQVLTSPCLLVRLPRSGLQQVRVVDPAGTLRATVTVLARPERDEERRERPARR